MTTIQEIKEQVQHLLKLIKEYEKIMVNDFEKQINQHLEIEMVEIPGGTFMMGLDEWKDSNPVHSVTLPSFRMGKYPVTQREWTMIMGNSLSNDKTDQFKPVTNVSWNDTQEFIQKLNSLTGKHYRLPTEAEWEYACADSVIGWNNSNCSSIMMVGLFTHNKYGLNDMLGNVYEWCEDDWHGNYQGSPTEGRAWVDSPRGSHRVFRGGSWLSNAGGCRAAYRNLNTPAGRSNNVGFRLAHD